MAATSPLPSLSLATRLPHLPFSPAAAPLPLLHFSGKGDSRAGILSSAAALISPFLPFPSLPSPSLLLPSSPSRLPLSPSLQPPYHPLFSPLILFSENRYLRAMAATLLSFTLSPFSPSRYSSLPPVRSSLPLIQSNELHAASTRSISNGHQPPHLLSSSLFLFFSFPLSAPPSRPYHLLHLSASLFSDLFSSSLLATAATSSLSAPSFRLLPLLSRSLFFAGPGAAVATRTYSSDNSQWP